MSNAQCQMILGDIFHLPPAALIQNSEMLIDFVNRVATAFFHADELIVSLVVAIAVEVAHEGVKELVVEEWGYAAFYGNS